MGRPASEQLGDRAVPGMENLSGEPVPALDLALAVALEQPVKLLLVRTHAAAGSTDVALIWGPASSSGARSEPLSGPGRRHRVQELTDLVIALEGMAEREIGVDRVAVPATHLGTGEVPG